MSKYRAVIEYECRGGMAPGDRHAVRVEEALRVAVSHIDSCSGLMVTNTEWDRIEEAHDEDTRS